MMEIEISEEDLENPNVLASKAMDALQKALQGKILQEEEAWILWSMEGAKARRTTSAETSSYCVMRGPSE